MVKGGIFRGSKRQRGGRRRYRGGIFRGTKRQRGGAIPLLAAVIPGVIAAAKAAAASAALGAAGAAGHEVVSAISRKVRGAGRRRRSHLRK